MNYLLFPDAYKKQKQKEQDRKQQELAEFVGSKRHYLTNELKRLENEYEEKKKTIRWPRFDEKFSSYLAWLSVRNYIKVGFIVSLIASVLILILCSFDNSIEDTGDFFIMIGVGIETGFLVRPLFGPIVGIVIAPILYPIYRRIHKSKMEEAYAVERSFNSQYKQLREQTQSQIEEEIANKTDQINRQIASLEQDVLSYTSAFEAEAQSQSVNYANSVLAKEVIEWLTSSYLKTIKSASRASYIEKVIVPFDFKVFKDRITCNTGSYDFKSHRCAELQSVIAQTALARAIASQIQLGIIMQYAKDSSGTAYSINIKYEYETESKGSYYSSPVEPATHCRMTYYAPNGNYKSVQDW